MPALAVITGAKVPTSTAEPLFSPLEVTMAVKLPALVGFFENVTVKDVAEALVTFPIAPLLKTTELFVGTGSKPKPSMTIVFAFAETASSFVVTTGVTVATWIGARLAIPFDVTCAVKLPALVGFVEKVTTSCVAVAAVTVPTAPLLNVTVLFAAVKSNPKPLIVTVFAFADRLAVALVTTGRAVPTWIAEPLLMPLVVTIALRLPAAGALPKFTANSVEVADTTVPVAPESNTIVLFSGVVSKPTPTIRICEALAFSIEPMFAVTTGDTPATCTAVPLLIVLVLTEAFNGPASAGLLTKVTVRDVAEAAVTLPVAPLSKVTVLLPGVGSNPKPLIVIVVALAATSPAGFAVTAGMIVAT